MYSLCLIRKMGLPLWGPVKVLSVYGICALFLFCLWHIGPFCLFISFFFYSIRWFLSAYKVFKSLYIRKFKEKYFSLCRIGWFISCLWYMGTPLTVQGPNCENGTYDKVFTVILQDLMWVCASIQCIYIHESRGSFSKQSSPVTMNGFACTLDHAKPLRSLTA